MNNAGYSGTPLVRKLGVTQGFQAVFLNAPEGYDEALGPLPDDVTVYDHLNRAPCDFIQLFVVWQDDLIEQFPLCKAALKKDGILWVSWCKKAAKMDTDLDGNIVREIGLENGLVDVKVAAVDEKWSGLKFVYRKEDR